MKFARIAGIGSAILCLLLSGCQPKANASATDASPRDSALVEGGFIPGELSGSSSSPTGESSLDIIRKYEAPEIAAHPDVASRRDNVLVITLDGTPVARFADRRAADCAASRTCVSWSFRGMESLLSQKGKREPYALIMQDGADGWSHFTFVGNERGLTWFSNWPEVSPGGRYIAEGSREGMDVTGFLRVVDWATPYPHTTYVFGAGCRPLKWVTPDTLQLHCDYPGHDGKAYATLASLKRDARGQWRLTETAEVADDDAETQVAPSKLKLRVLDGKPAEADKDVKAFRKVATDAQLVAEGMDWLGPAGP